MNYRRFGRAGWSVSEIGYGMWGMAGWTGSEDQESMDSLQHAVDLGCNFFDTAWAYGDGHSETLLGKIIHANPLKTLYAATKIPPKNRRWPSQRGFSMDESYPPEYIEEYVHKSLENIGVNKLDLIQFHTWEDHWLDDDRLLKAIEKLRTGNEVRAVGISINRWEPWNGIRAVNSGLIDVVQVIYNIFDQAPEDKLLPLCQELNVGVIARVPLDEGSLGGKMTLATRFPKSDWRSGYFGPENLANTIQRVAQLKKILPEGMTLPEMSLRFILSHPAVSTTIVGMRTPEHVRENVAASDAGPLDSALLAELKKHRWDRTPQPWSD